MVSIDTEYSWIARTISNIKLFEIDDENLDFFLYSAFVPVKQYDFIFDDGADSLRREFAIKMWPYLKVGGLIAFHDTRRGHDFRNVLEVLATFQDEIDHVYFNAEGSNITCVYKKNPEPYDNWQISEDKKAWQLGWEEPPKEFIDGLKNKPNP